jgi:hypothetical protein
LGVSHESENGFIFVIATNSCGNVVTFRDFREIAPFVFLRRIVEVMSLFESTNEDELLFSILLNRYDSGSHASFGHFGDFD